VSRTSATPIAQERSRLRAARNEDLMTIAQYYERYAFDRDGSAEYHCGELAGSWHHLPE
jgi:hypothetical protein